MLNKLLKYEFKATARWFLPLYIALIVLTLLNKLTMIVELPEIAVFTVLEVLLMVFYVMIIIFTSIATLILLLVRFYKNLYTDEGYLTHTLPVKPSMHLNCKLLSGFIWNVASGVVQIISLFILFAGEGLFSELAEVFGEAGEYLKSAGLFDNAIVTLIIFVVIMIMSVFYNLLMMYCSLSLGSLLRQYKILGAILAYFVINFVIQILGTIVAVIGMNTPIVYEILMVEDFTAEIFNLMNIFMGVSGVLTLICSAIFYFLSHFAMSKKLNLD